MHTPRQQSAIGFTSLRNTITWFFIVMLAIYSLYSINLILTKYPDSNPNCINETKIVEAYKFNLLNIESSQIVNNSVPALDEDDDTLLKHVIFGIAASSRFWRIRKEYIKLWWRPGETRGVVWLDNKVAVIRNEKLPEIRISGDTSKFNYTNRQGSRSALRISRVVSETLRLGMKDVRWFVMGDDDTVFIVENLLSVLNKYDHNQYYYIGSSSESHIQNILFSYTMAYGGGGFAISYALALQLEKIQDGCIQRYPRLYGSDDRIQACMAELGVPLTKEAGFHQYDIYGNLLGLLGAHPVAPLVSLHHLDVVDPIFPDMTRLNSLRKFFQSVEQDSASILQQSICYDKERYWSISVSWGYVIQIIRGHVSPRELETPARTFLNWYKKADYTAYAFNTRPVARHPCQKPFLFYLSSAKYDKSRRQIIGIYSRHKETYPYCRWKSDPPEKLDSIVVLKKPDNLRWKRVNCELGFYFLSACLTDFDPHSKTRLLALNLNPFTKCHIGGIAVELYHPLRNQSCTYGSETAEKGKLVKYSKHHFGHGNYMNAGGFDQ